MLVPKPEGLPHTSLWSGRMVTNGPKEFYFLSSIGIYLVPLCPGVIQDVGDMDRKWLIDFGLTLHSLAYLHIEAFYYKTSSRISGEQKHSVSRSLKWQACLYRKGCKVKAAEAFWDTEKKELIELDILNTCFFVMEDMSPCLSLSGVRTTELVISDTGSPSDHSRKRWKLFQSLRQQNNCSERGTALSN